MHGEKRATREYCENRSYGEQQGRREHQRCKQTEQSAEANGGVQVPRIDPKRDRKLSSSGNNKGKSSVVQMERVETSHSRQADIIKTEGEGIQEYGETGAVVRCRDIGDKRD